MLEMLKQKLYDTIDTHKEEIIKIADTILKNPELGYYKEKTSQLVRKPLII